MPDAPAAPAAPAPAAPAPAAPASNTTLFAGKYKTPDDLQKGIREAWKATGLPGAPAEGQNLIGQGAMFATTEEAETGYKKFEALIPKGPAAPATPASPPAAPTGLPQIGAPADAAAEPDDELDTATLLVKSGLNGDELTAQFAKEGKLTADQVAAIRKANPSLKTIPTKLLNEHMALVVGNHQKTVAEVLGQMHTLAGGKDKFDVLLDWAAGSYKPQEMAALNTRLRNTATAVAATKEMLFDYSTKVGANGTAPLIGASTGGSTVTKPTNLVEYTALVERMKSGDKNALAIFEQLTPAERRAFR